jgi:hypothetical protein
MSIIVCPESPTNNGNTEEEQKQWMNTHLEHRYKVRDSKCGYVNEYCYDENPPDLVDEVTLPTSHFLNMSVLKAYVLLLAAVLCFTYTEHEFHSSRFASPA